LENYINPEFEDISVNEITRGKIKSFLLGKLNEGYARSTVSHMMDFNGRFIQVRRSVVRGVISTPKNGKLRRVDMSLQLTEALKIHEAESKKKGMALGFGRLPEFVFTNETGAIIDTDNWRRRVFSKALTDATLRTIRIHDLRHTYATLRISKGDNIADVSGQLEHHSIKLTLDTHSQRCSVSSGVGATGNRSSSTGGNFEGRGITNKNVIFCHV